MLLEALACGTPVVASRLPGVRTLVDDGRTGYLVEPGNVDELADTIGRCIRESAALGPNAQAFVRARYGWPTIAAGAARRSTSACSPGCPPANERAPRAVLVIFGTRPEAIKLAPVVTALAAEPTLAPRLCVSGQHREMLDQMLTLFDIRAAPRPRRHAARPGSVRPHARARSPGCAPCSTPNGRPPCWYRAIPPPRMAAALAAFYRKVPVGHVEAGLRTDQVYDPFPEEMNRRLTTQLAAWHYAPTARAAANLRREGVPGERIVVTGNTIVDALHDHRRPPRPRARRPARRPWRRAHWPGADWCW